MNRRDFFKSASLYALFLSSQKLYAEDKDSYNLFLNWLNDLLNNKEKEEIIQQTIEESDIIHEPVDNITSKVIKEEVKKRDVFVEDKYQNEFLSVREKLKHIQNHVGYGNFNIIGFDETLNISKQLNKIESFSSKEIEFLESIFYYNPTVHGFYGERVSHKITQEINKSEIVKIPNTGHYLFKGEPYKVYNQMLNDIGDTLILTSGVRSIVKQTKLFLDKLYSVDGNLSIASRSLAPPAFTYHSISDFDVGKKGYGYANFTSEFALTEEFLQMRKLKYIDMRYTIDNKDGVRYEPWHVKVI